jgi:ketosteroid isomerase-like protein
MAKKTAAKKTAVKRTAAQRTALRAAARDLREFKKEFQEASRNKDREALNRMIHDDFTLVDPNGREVTKQRLIDDIVHNNTDFMGGFRRREIRTTFQQDGNAARETANVTMRGTLQRHGDISGRYINSATFLKGPNGWQMAGNTLHKL